LKKFLTVCCLLAGMASSYALGIPTAKAEDIYACANKGVTFYVMDETIRFKSADDMTCIGKAVENGRLKSNPCWHFYKRSGTWFFDLSYDGIAKGVNEPLERNFVAKSVWTVCNNYS